MVILHDDQWKSISTPKTTCQHPLAMILTEATKTNVLSNHVFMVHATNTNLTAQEKELVQWHNRFGHMGFCKVQVLM